MNLGGVFGLGGFFDFLPGDEGILVGVLGGGRGVCGLRVILWLWGKEKGDVRVVDFWGFGVFVLGVL